MNVFGSKHNSSSKDDVNSILTDCYDLNWLVDSSGSAQDRNKDYLCCICKKIANNALELTCQEHESNDEAIIVGESCLHKYLKEHDDRCPIGNHSKCTYQKSGSVRKQINKIQIMCPKQYQILMHNTSSTKSAKQLFQAFKREMIDVKKQPNPSENSGYYDKACTFKGCIKDLENHLLSECSLNASVDSAPADSAPAKKHHKKKKVKKQN